MHTHKNPVKITGIWQNKILSPENNAFFLLFHLLKVFSNSLYTVSLVHVPSISGNFTSQIAVYIALYVLLKFSFCFSFPVLLHLFYTTFCSFLPFYFCLCFPSFLKWLFSLLCGFFRFSCFFLPSNGSVLVHLMNTD
jgi:hypothetical protein